MCKMSLQTRQMVDWHECIVAAANHLDEEVAASGNTSKKLLNSKQIKDLNAAFDRDKMLTTKFERQIEEVKRHQDSPHLSLLYYSIKQFLGADHLLMAILKEVLLSALVNINGEEERLEMASLMKQESKDGVQYNPLDAGALVEGGKVIGQNSFKMAGQVWKSS